jgi:hypothetical protein
MVHSKDLSEKNAKIINDALGNIFEDSSWHNDACDSIFCEDLDMQIFLPTTTDVNADRSQEEYNTFTVGEDVNYGDDTHTEFNTVEEVIAHVKTTEYFRLGEFIKKI